MTKKSYKVSKSKLKTKSKKKVCAGSITKRNLGLYNKKKIWKANPVIRNKKPIENSTILPEQIVKSNIFNKAKNKRQIQKELEKSSLKKKEFAESLNDRLKSLNNLLEEHELENAVKNLLVQDQARLANENSPMLKTHSSKSLMSENSSKKYASSSSTIKEMSPRSSPFSYRQILPNDLQQLEEQKDTFEELGDD